MRRKIIKQGNNSFTVTLPVSWIRKNHIKSEVDVEEIDNNIIISTEGGKKPISEINVNLKNYEIRSIKNIIFQLYRQGYDKITCKLNNKDQANIVRNIVSQNLLGFEVVDETAGRIVIENIAEPSQDKFDTLFNKLFFIIKTNAREILDDIENHVNSKLEKHTTTKNMFDVYTNLLRRLILKYNKSGNKESYLLFFAVSQLSYIQHAMFYLYKDYTKKPKSKADAKSIEFMRDYCDILDLLYTVYAKKNIDAAHEIGQKYLEYKDKMLEFLDSRSGHKSIIHHLLTGLRHVHLSTTVVFGLHEYN